MKCPRCYIDLQSSDREYGFVIIDVCPGCHGAWFDKGDLDRLDGSVWTNVEQLDFEPADSRHAALHCPVCRGDMEPLSPHAAKELVVDRCPSCEGFWLDKDKLDKMQEIAAEEDSEILKKMVCLQRPPDCSWLRWTILCFKACYFKRSRLCMSTLQGRAEKIKGERNE